MLEQVAQPELQAVQVVWVPPGEKVLLVQAVQEVLFSRMNPASQVEQTPVVAAQAEHPVQG